MTGSGLYLPGQGWLHRLHPLTRLTFCLAALVVIFGGPAPWLSAALPGLLVMLALGFAGLVGLVLRRIIRLWLPLALVLFVVHGLFGPENRTLLLELGPLKLGREGLVYAGLTGLRLASALAASLMVVITTHPARLIQALVELGLPTPLAYLLGSPLLLLPQLAGRVQAIQAAQQSRGLETRGTLFQRIRALFPLVAPLVFSALIDVEEHALALEARGFSAPAKKTSLAELSDTTAQRVARWMMAALALLLLLVRLYGRVLGNP